MGTLANSEDPDEMLHNVNFIRVCLHCSLGQNIQERRNTNYFFKKKKLTQMGKSDIIRESNQASGVRKAHHV